MSDDKATLLQRVIGKDKEFPYVVSTSVNNGIWTSLYSMIPDFPVCDGNIGGSQPILAINPPTGLHNFCGVDVKIVNQSKQRIIVMSFRSKEDMLKLNKIIFDRTGQETSYLTPTMKYNPAQDIWRHDSEYQSKSRGTIVGFDSYVDQIMKIINQHEKYTNHLKKIGECRSLNILLFGVPGTGKSSIVRIIASMMDAPIFIVNPKGVNVRCMDNILNVTRYSGYTPKPGQKFIILFEDLDRFLDEPNMQDIMSSLLNSLDGVVNSNNCIRFFTGNNCDTILKNEALVSRMSERFYFGLPTTEMYSAKLKLIQFTPIDFDDPRLVTILQNAEHKKANMRSFVNFCLRHIFDDDPLGSMLLGIDKL